MTPRVSLKTNPRRGVAVLWTLALLPVLIILLIVVVEVLNLWIARVELETAMEASALAAVKEWAETAKGLQGLAGVTTVARDYGVTFAEANTVRGRYINTDQDGNPIVEFETNHDSSNDPNGNLACTGNLIFGSIPLEPPGPPYSFNAGTIPQCEYDEEGKIISLDIRIESPPSGGTFGTNDLFTISFNMENADGSYNRTEYITQISIQLDAVDDDAVFNFGGSSGEATELADVVREGSDPAFNPDNNTVSPTVSPAPSSIETGTLVLDFADDDFLGADLSAIPIPGDVLQFGVDTDRVQGESPSGQEGPDVAGDTDDHAGEFNTANFVLTISFSSGEQFTLSGDQATGSSTNHLNFTGSYDFSVHVDPTGEYGVRAQAMVDVPSLVGSLCGNVLGPFQVQAQATARAACTTDTNPVAIPELVHIQTFTCP